MNFQPVWHLKKQKIKKSFKCIEIRNKRKVKKKKTYKRKKKRARTFFGEFDRE